MRSILSALSGARTLILSACMHAGVHRKRLSAKYRQLGQDGFVSAHEYLPGLEPGTVDRQHSKATGMLASLLQSPRQLESHHADFSLTCWSPAESPVCPSPFPLLVGLILRQEVARSIKAHNRAGGEVKTVALKVLATLEYFLPVRHVPATQCLL